MAWLLLIDHVYFKECPSFYLRPLERLTISTFVNFMSQCNNGGRYIALTFSIASK